MDYKPGKPKHNYNVSENAPGKEFAILFLGVSGIVFGIYLLLGLMIDVVVDNIPEHWTHVEFDKNWRLEADFEHSEPLQKIIDELVLCADIAHPVIISTSKAEEVNAFALPNGQIVVFDGLLQAVKSENGLAFVLAHELSHFKNRDHLRQMGRGIIIASLLALVSGDAAGINQSFTPAMMAGNANYSQEREIQADIRAMEILHCHYGHVGGATELFEYYRDLPADLLRDSFLSSHPAPAQRIDTINDMIKENGWRIADTTRLNLQ